MKEIIGGNSDLIAGILRSQISVLQETLYNLENSSLDSQMIKERMKAVNRRNATIIDHCDGIAKIGLAMM